MNKKVLIILLMLFSFAVIIGAAISGSEESTIHYVGVAVFIISIIGWLFSMMLLYNMKRRNK